jgi:hypothetical protein
VSLNVWAKLNIKLFIMKKLANLKGAKSLSKQEQKSVNGGFAACVPACPRGCICTSVGCRQDPNSTYLCPQ